MALLEYWEDQDHVQAAGIHDWPWKEELAEAFPWREQLIAVLNNKPIGFVQIIDPIESNKRVHRFYQKLGFKFVENRYLDDDYCSIFSLSREDWERVSQ